MRIFLYLIIVSLIFGIIQYVIKDFLYLDLFIFLISDYAIIEKKSSAGIVFSSIIGIIEDLFTGNILFSNMFLKSFQFYIFFYSKNNYFYRTKL